jgi:hypothetical protein
LENQGVTQHKFIHQHTTTSVHMNTHRHHQFTSTHTISSALVIGGQIIGVIKARVVVASEVIRTPPIGRVIRIPSKWVIEAQIRRSLGINHLLESTGTSTKLNRHVLHIHTNIMLTHAINFALYLQSSTPTKPSSTEPKLEIVGQWPPEEPPSPH